MGVKNMILKRQGDMSQYTKYSCAETHRDKHRSISSCQGKNFTISSLLLMYFVLFQTTNLSPTFEFLASFIAKAFLLIS